MKSSNIRRIGASIAIASALVLVPAGVAFASTWETIGATNPCTNCLVQHSTPRYHPVSSGMTFQSKTLPPCGGALRLGLRNTSGVQFVPTVEWAAINITKSFNGGSAITAQWFYMNSNVTGICIPSVTPTWSGSLMY